MLDGDVQRVRREGDMTLMKAIVGCLNLIRFSVLLTDVIVLIGSFVPFTHSVDVTVGMFSACLTVSSPPSASAGSSVSLSAFYYIISVCLCLSLLDWLKKSWTSE